MEREKYGGGEGGVRPSEAQTVFTSFESHRVGQPLTAGGLRCIFRSVGKRAGLAAFSPHDLRRTFATIASLLGAPSAVLMVAGRWHDIKLVERYTQAVRAKDFARYSPVHGVLNS